MPVPIQLHVTPRFTLHLDVILEAVGIFELVHFKRDLANAVQFLESTPDWPFQSHGYFGHDFSYPINEEFLLVFRMDTDRDAHGKPLLRHFYLKTIERISA